MVVRAVRLELECAGGEAKDGGGEKSEGEVSFLYLIIMFFSLVCGVLNFVRLFRQFIVA